MALAEKTPPSSRQARQSALDRPLVAGLTFNWEVAAYAAFILFAVATRFWDLGTRAIHHDESLHAIYSWYLYMGKGYQHDPMMHGPFQFHAVALIYLLFGASDYTARVLPALFGVWVVASPYFLRREMGRYAALIASALFAISPGYLYFSRFIRNDIYMAGWAMMIVIGIFGYIREKKPAYFYLLAAGTAFSFATKETVYITGFAFLSFFVLDAALAVARRRVPVGYATLRSISFRNWLVAIGIFVGINLVLYTTFFTNPKGLLSGTTGALAYWLDQHEVQRGGQPWFYYLILVPLYEFLPLLVALGGFVFLAVRRRLQSIGYFASFLAVWFLIVAVVYSWAGEKMPWLSIHITQPLILLAALVLGGLFERSSFSLFARRQGLIALVLAGLLASVVLGGLIAAPPLSGSQLGVQTEHLRRGAMWLMVGASVLSLVIVGRRSGARTVLIPASFGLLIVMLVLTIRSGWEVAYSRGDIPRDLLVYVQSSPDVPRVVREIDRLAYQTGAGKDMKILLDGGYTENGVVYESISWPFEWYLRDYRAKSYYSKTLPTAADAPVILSMVANQAPIRGEVTNYVANRGRLNWWYPEDYKGLTLESLWNGLQDASIRSRLWRYFLYKETLNPLGSRDFDFFVRSDLSRGTPVQGVAFPASQPIPQVEPADVSAQVYEGGITVYGLATDGSSIIREPRGVDLSTDGLIYAADASGAKIVAFKTDGSVAYQWGRKGTGDGEFNEPWGVAVAPNGDVYVADTWNHRVQKFDKTGKFIAKWGTFADVKGDPESRPGAFWGPRDIAIAQDGNVLVTDTGNKRVQIFDAGGRFISMFGGEGSEPGMFREPVGIAVDGSGAVYVADAWNRRIQKFDAQYNPLAQFTVEGWGSQSVVNKPYLAVDQQGRLYYTEPEKHRVVILDSSGRQEGVMGALGTSPTTFNNPTGIAVSPSGEVFVGDGRNSRVVRRQTWR